MSPVGAPPEDRAPDEVRFLLGQLKPTIKLRPSRAGVLFVLAVGRYRRLPGFGNAANRSARLSGGKPRRPGPLEIISAEPSGDIDDFSHEKEPRHFGGFSRGAFFIPDNAVAA